MNMLTRDSGSRSNGERMGTATPRRQLPSQGARRVRFLTSLRTFPEIIMRT